MDEEWKTAADCEGNYQISNLGRARRAKPGINTYVGRILKPITITGYPTFWIRKLVAIHTLVLTAFVGPRPPGCIAHHKNGDWADNRLENLEWVTRSRHYQLHDFEGGAPTNPIDISTISNAEYISSLC